MIAGTHCRKLQVFFLFLRSLILLLYAVQCVLRELLTFKVTIWIMVNMIK